MLVYFLSEVNCPNYKDGAEIYTTLSLGRISHIGYYYWILKNSGIKNIKLIRSLDEIDNTDQSIVFFYRAVSKGIQYDDEHYPFYNLENLKCIKIQVVGDTDVIEWADYNLINNPCGVDEKKKFIPFPLPTSLNRKNINNPPRIFASCSHKFNLDHNFEKKKTQTKLNELGVELLLEYNKNFITDDFDVFFFLRNKNINLMKNNDGTLKHPYSGYKHPNRLFQAWYMNTPCILNRESQIKYFIQSELDCLFADDIDEFYKNTELLINDKHLYLDMVEHYKTKEIPNSNENICKFFIEYFKQFNLQLI